jgi:hypothetical protein
MARLVGRHVDDAHRVARRRRDQQLRQKCPDLVLGFMQTGGPMQQRSDCAGLMMARRVMEQLGIPGEHYSS